MSQGRIFADDWRDCLREQYKYVIRQQDSRTEATLIDVLVKVGFTDDELAALRLEATMRDMPDDYVPDEIRSMTAGVDLSEAIAEPVVEESEPVTEDVDDEPEEEIPVTYDELVAEETQAEPDAEVVDDEPEDSPDSPQQMSLF